MDSVQELYDESGIDFLSMIHDMIKNHFRFDESWKVNFSFW